MLPRALQRIKVPRPRTGSIILPRTTNKGEEAEYRHALALYKLTQNPVAAEALFGPDASEGITLINQETGKQIEREEDIPKKAGGSYKADHWIKFNKTDKSRYLSSKHLGGGKASLINSTSRANFYKNEFLSGLLEGEAGLDSIIQSKLWPSRKNGERKEEAPVTSLKLTKDQNQTLLSVLSYFLFTGTASHGDSRAPADAMLIGEAESLKFIDCSSPEQKNQYMESIWGDRLILCLRPKRNSAKRYIEDDERNKPWIHKRWKLIKKEEGGKEYNQQHANHAEKTETHIAILVQMLSIRLKKAR